MAILRTLLEINIYSAIVLMSILLFKKTAGKKLSPVMHYALWFLLIARLAVPYTFDSGVRLVKTPAAPVQAIQPEITQDSTVSPVPASAPALQAKASQTQTEQQASDILPAAASQQNAGSPLNTESLLLSLYILGACTTLCVTVNSYWRLKRHLIKNSSPAPDDLQRLFHRTSQELGIRRQMTLCVTDNLSTPVLCGRTVLLPGSMLRTGDAQHIRFALIHELTHYARKDHITLLCMAVLQCLHWFNPLVWVAFRLMRTDMEAACDYAVAVKLSIAQKQAYASQIIQMSARGAKPYILLGMARHSAKKAVATRIHSIFGEKHSRPFARACAVLLVAALVFACFTTACQPTPEKEVVVKKDTDIMLDKALSTPAPSTHAVATPGQPQWPDSYAYSAQDSSRQIKLSVDAKLSVPDYTSMSVMPLMRVKMHAFSQSDVDTLIRALIKDNQIYQPGEETVYTREQLQQRIIETKRLLSDTDNWVLGVSPEMMEEKLLWYEERLSSAPETLADAQLKPSDGLLQTGDPYGFGHNYDYFSAIADLGQAYMAQIRFSYDPISKNSDFYFDSGAFFDGSPAPAELTTPLGGAQRQADAVMRELGLRDYVLTNALKDTIMYAGHDVWQLDFSRSISGHPVSNIAGRTTNPFSGETYAPEWASELFRFTIDDNGIQNIMWSSPYDIVEQVTNDPALLSFDDIKSRFESQFFTRYNYEAVFDKGLEYRCEYVIDSVQLTLMRISEKDADTALLVPVWQFCGCTRTDIEDPGGDLKTMPGSEGTALLQINAVDGSIVY